MTTIAETSDLGLALLIAESEDGGYEPVSPVGTVQEAREIASDDFRGRIGELATGGTRLCPYVYKVWVRGADGQYATAAEIPARSGSDR